LIKGVENESKRSTKYISCVSSPFTQRFIFSKNGCVSSQNSGAVKIFLVLLIGGSKTNTNSKLKIVQTIFLIFRMVNAS
jgi:hypothetical protein